MSTGLRVSEQAGGTAAQETSVVLDGSHISEARSSDSSMTRGPGRSAAYTAHPHTTSSLRGTEPAKGRTQTRPPIPLVE